MNKTKQQVQKFYDVIWNAYDKSAIPSVLHEDVSFRGSLGQEKRGHKGFAEYVDTVHKALGNYRCDIQELICEDNKVFARMIFSGIHQNEFLGYLPTMKKLSWAGCAVFTFNDDRMLDIWVLGDLKGLEAQLQENAR
ncbi:MAG: ester cyclase [Gammaproteobacteria bacterium]|nr:ester cyclase [Gammaproteobacteria bacterium]